MKRKGFTLIELLAVIIILAVIALITTPIVLNVVDEAKKSAFSASVNGVIDGIRYNTLEAQFAGNTVIADYTFPSDDIKVQGSQPDGGTAKVDKDGKVQIAVHNGKWCATKDFDEEKITIKDYVEGECVVGVNESNQLQAPTISINDNVLYIESNDENVEEYEIYVDGVLKTTISATPVVEINKLSGIWQFNDVLTVPSKRLTQTVGFSCVPNEVLFNGEVLLLSFTGIDVFPYTSTGVAVSYIGDIAPFPGLGFYKGETGDYWNFLANAYGDPSYSGIGQTITFTEEQEVSAEFYTWFTANANQIGLSYDLSSLNLENGIYDITVKTVAEGYESSEFSNTVEYTVGNILGGTWKFNDVLNLPSDGEGMQPEIGFFTPNSFYYSDTNATVTDEPKFYNFLFVDDTSVMYSPDSSDYTRVYDFENRWNSAAVMLPLFGYTVNGNLDGYGQTITFTEEQEVSDEFYTWFTANATKQ